MVLGEFARPVTHSPSEITSMCCPRPSAKCWEWRCRALKLNEQFISIKRPAIGFGGCLKQNRKHTKEARSSLYTNNWLKFEIKTTFLLNIYFLDLIHHSLFCVQKTWLLFSFYKKASLIDIKEETLCIHKAESIFVILKLFDKEMRKL